MAPLVRFPTRGVKVERPPREMKNVVLSYPVEQFFDITPAQLADRPIAARRAQQIYALAHACMHYRAAKLSEPPLWIYEEQDGEEVPIEGDHPLAEWLEQPNPDMGMADLLELMSLYWDATGAVLLVKNRDRSGIPRSTYPYARDEFQVEPANGRLFGKFRVQTLTGYREFGPDDVIYLPLPSSQGIMQTAAPMEAALEHINIGQNMRTAIKAAMRNTARPGTIFTAEGNLGDDVFNRLRAEIRENYEGVWNTGASMLLEGGVKPNPQKATLDDLALGPINEDVEVAVCQAFAMHPVLVGSKIGLSANSGLSDSIKPAEALFYDTVAFPQWARIEKALTRGLLRDLDSDPLRFIRFDKAKVRALQPDMTEKITQAAAAVFWTEEEKRQWTGKEGGSDELPSDQAERIAEQTATDSEGMPDEGGTQPTKSLNRIVDLVKTDTGYRATVSASRNGNGTH